MMFKLFSGIFKLVCKQQVKFTHSIQVISIIVLLFLPAGLVSGPHAQTGAPSGWTAHNPIIILTPPQKSNSMAPFAISGLYPAQIRKAYGIDLLGNSGAGKTIAIIDAYGSPTVASDLATFNTQFGLPSASLTIHGTSQNPVTQPGWAMETALDVEWAHAIAPAANILLVIAPSNSFADLLAAINTATTNGADVVSMSWGGFEWAGESGYDSYFNNPATPVSHM